MLRVYAVYSASHTLHACAHSAVLANFCQSQVNQLCHTVQQHDVVGLEVAVSIRIGGVGVRAFGVHIEQCTAYAYDDAQLLLVGERRGICLEDASRLGIRGQRDEVNMRR